MAFVVAVPRVDKLCDDRLTRRTNWGLWVPWVCRVRRGGAEDRKIGESALTVS